MPVSGFLIIRPYGRENKFKEFFMKRKRIAVSVVAALLAFTSTGAVFAQRDPRNQQDQGTSSRGNQQGSADYRNNGQVTDRETQRQRDEAAAAERRRQQEAAEAERQRQQAAAERKRQEAEAAAARAREEEAARKRQEQLDRSYTYSDSQGNSFILTPPKD